MANAVVERHVLAWCSSWPSPTKSRTAIYRFRYCVYVEEMGRKQSDADHRARRIRDGFDDTAHLVGAWRGADVVGTLRTNFLRDGDAGYYEQFYGLDALSAQSRAASSMTTRLMVAPHLRRSRVAWQLVVGAYEVALAAGIEQDFVDCNAHLLPLFEHLGYRVCRAGCIHHDYGRVSVLRLAVTDAVLLAAVQSPFLSVLEQSRYRSSAPNASGSCSETRLAGDGLTGSVGLGVRGDKTR